MASSSLLRPQTVSYVDFSFTFPPHIEFLRKSHCFDPQNISRIQLLFTIFTSATLIQPTAVSWLDDCNSFHTDFLAVATFLEHQSDHSTPLLRSFHGVCHTQVGLPKNRHWNAAWSIWWYLVRSMPVKGKGGSRMGRRRSWTLAVLGQPRGSSGARVAY